MLLIAFSWALASSETLDLPWDMSLIRGDSDCPQLCGNWSALFLSDNGCKGRDMVLLDDKDTVGGTEVVVGETVRFCPDKEVVQAWSVEKELVYIAMYLRRDGLLKTESDIFRRMTYEREMKLSVHPWQKFSAEELNGILERRRIKGSSIRMKCLGEKTGTRHKWFNNEKPYKVATQFNDADMLNHIELKYPSGNMKVGTLANVGTYKKQGLPDCVQVVFMKFDGTRINGIQFLSQGQETRFFGVDENESFIYIAPSGRCLADTRIRGDELIDRLCIRFNGVDNE